MKHDPGKSLGITIAELRRGETYMVPIGLMFVEQIYGHQRPLSEAWVEARIKLFDPALLGVAEVSARKVEGGGLVFAILDGQHRRYLCEAVKHDAIECKVHFELTVQQEAKMFRGLNDARPLSATGKFAAAVAVGQKNAVALARALDEIGFRIAPGRSKDNKQNIGSATLIQELFRGYGKTFLQRAFVIFRNSFPKRKPLGVDIAGILLLLKAGCDETHLRKTLGMKEGEKYHPSVLKMRIKRKIGITPRVISMPGFVAREWLEAYQSERGNRQKVQVTVTQLNAAIDEYEEIVGDLFRRERLQQ